MSLWMFPHDLTLASLVLASLNVSCWTFWKASAPCPHLQKQVLYHNFLWISSPQGQSFSSRVFLKWESNCYSSNIKCFSFSFFVSLFLFLMREWNGYMTWNIISIGWIHRQRTQLSSSRTDTEDIFHILYKVDLLLLWKACSYPSKTSKSLL